jgi:peptidyl-prolyl cis-trans isomerase A (cyclophilin A)
VHSRHQQDTGRLGRYLKISLLTILQKLDLLRYNSTMTQIRRPAKQQQRVTLLRVFLALAGILSVAVALFQFDSFPKRRTSGSASSSLTPDQLTQMQILPSRERLRRRPDGSDTELEINGDIQGGMESSVLEEGSRRFAFEVGGLKDGQMGTIIIETRPKWAPIGVEHFHTLVENQFYDQCRFFRVVDDFMVQFGIAASPDVQKEWKTKILKDDPTVMTNKRGTLTYATSGKDSRTTQLFINTRANGNGRLDGQGFAPFGEVITGMEFVDAIENKYGEKPGQGKIVNQGNAYLEKEFPDLSYIVTVRDVTSG